MRNLILGFDTSNYTTSIALTSQDGEIICDSRKLLKVKMGERGLRQSDALFQHMENLPVMAVEVLKEYNDQICAVSCSDKPRNVEGSYMPVFKAGLGFSEVIASALSVPLYQFSHQDGHIASGTLGSNLSAIKDNQEPFIAFHLSGGTTEILKIDYDDNQQYKIEIIGGTKDISFGQLVDRVGVKLGLQFPAGAQMDEIALDSHIPQGTVKYPNIHLDDLYINLSGIETHFLKLTEIEDGKSVIKTLFTAISDCLNSLTKRAILQYNIKKVLFVGGVSASEFIRTKIRDENIIFSDRDLSSDNAVGIAILGGKRHGFKANQSITDK